MYALYITVALASWMEWYITDWSAQAVVSYLPTFKSGLELGRRHLSFTYSLRSSAQVATNRNGEWILDQCMASELTLHVPKLLPIPSLIPRPPPSPFLVLFPGPIPSVIPRPPPSFWLNIAHSYNVVCDIIFTSQRAFIEMSLYEHNERDVVAKAEKMRGAKLSVGG